MSSRQEKEQRRAEREAAERKAAAQQARKGRLRLALGALVALAAIALAALVFGKSNSSKDGVKPPATSAATALPPLKDANLQSAAKAAGCTLATTPNEGRDHTAATVKYKVNPPTSGNHNPVAAQDGIYDPGNAPPIGMALHALEHGRVDIQYRKGTSRKAIDALETLGSEKLNFSIPGYKVLVFENQTKMPAAVAATAWTHSLTCPKLTPGFYDAVRDFRTAYTDKGPELNIPPTNG